MGRVYQIFLIITLVFIYPFPVVSHIDGTVLIINISFNVSFLTKFCDERLQRDTARWYDGLVFYCV